MKYWKSQGYSKKQVKEWCIDKCVKYVKNFNSIKDGPDLKKSIDKVWRGWKTKGDNPSKLREIDYVEFPKEVLDWFLALENDFVIPASLWAGTATNENSYASVASTNVE